MTWKSNNIISTTKVENITELWYRRHSHTNQKGIKVNQKKAIRTEVC